MRSALGARSRTWGAALTAAVAITVLTGGLFAPAGAATATSAKAVPAIAQQTNAHRAANGRTSLEASDDLNKVAQAWAKQLASSGTLKHNPKYSAQIPSGWRSAGENVAYNCGDASPVNRMMTQWKTSEGHNANMLNSAFTHIGVGWATDSRGCSWGVQVLAGYPATARVASTSTALKSIAVAPKPRITGTVQVGKTLTAKAGTWTSSVALSYQWRRDGKTISGATGSTYRAKAADAGHVISVKVTGKRAGYTTRSQVSAPTAKVRLGTISVTNGKVSSAASVGSVLKVSNSTVAPTSAKRMVEWRRDGEAIRGQTGPTYKITRADVGKRITAKVSFRTSGYESKTVWFHRYPRS